MRNADLMIELLEQMSSAPSGQILLIRPAGMSDQELDRYHHAELLDDAGLAIWKSDSEIRITNLGYDFLSAVNQDRRNYIAKCKEFLGEGTPLLNAVNAIIALVKNL